MKPYGTYSSKSKFWYAFLDKLPTKKRRYFNKSTRKTLKDSLKRDNEINEN